MAEPDLFGGPRGPRDTEQLVQEAVRTRLAQAQAQWDGLSKLQEKLAAERRRADIAKLKAAQEREAMQRSLIEQQLEKERARNKQVGVQGTCLQA